MRAGRARTTSSVQAAPRTASRRALLGPEEHPVRLEELPRLEVRVPRLERDEGEPELPEQQEHLRQQVRPIVELHNGQLELHARDAVERRAGGLEHASLVA